MNNGRLKVGIAGLGGAGRAHIARFREVANRAELVAVHDHKASNLERAVSEMDLRGVTATADWQEFLNTPGLQIVSLCTPDYAHCQQALDCVARNIHVLCEKPMANNMSDARRIYDAVSASKVKYMVHHQMRYVPLFVAMRNYALTEGKIGRMLSVECDYIHDMRKRSLVYDDWRLKPELRTTSIHGGACHPLDLMQWAVNDRIVEAFAYGNHLSYTDFPEDDTTYAVVKFRSGMVGRMTMSIGCSAPQANTMTLLGTEGTIADGLLLHTDNPPKMVAPWESMSRKKQMVTKLAFAAGALTRLPFNSYQHHLACLNLVNAFLDSIVNNTPVPISPLDSMDVIGICDAVVESARTGKPVPVQRSE